MNRNRHTCKLKDEKKKRLPLKEDYHSSILSWGRRILYITVGRWSFSLFILAGCNFFIIQNCQLLAAGEQRQWAEQWSPPSCREGTHCYTVTWTWNNFLERGCETTFGAALWNYINAAALSLLQTNRGAILISARVVKRTCFIRSPWRLCAQTLQRAILLFHGERQHSESCFKREQIAARGQQKKLLLNLS
jgi:hypothetical protein